MPTSTVAPPRAAGRASVAGCPKCGCPRTRSSWQNFKDGSTHLRQTCAECDHFLRYLSRDHADVPAPSPEPAQARPDARAPAAPGTACPACGAAEYRLVRDGAGCRLTCARCGGVAAETSPDAARPRFQRCDLAADHPARQAPPATWRWLGLVRRYAAEAGALAAKLSHAEDVLAAVRADLARARSRPRIPTFSAN